MHRIFTFFCFLFALIPLLVLSAEKKAEGMPQLDTSTYPSLIFWLLITFSITFFILKGFITPKLSDILVTRQNKLENDIEAAKKLREEAETYRVEQEAALKDAKILSSKQYKDKIDEVKHKILDDETALNLKLNAKIEKGEKRILESKKVALKKITVLSSEITFAIVKKLIKTKISKEAIRKVVDINANNFSEINQKKSE